MQDAAEDNFDFKGEVVSMVIQRFNHLQSGDCYEYTVWGCSQCTDRPFNWLKVIESDADIQST